MEKDKGIFKKERILVDIIALDTVKFYNGEAQIKQKSDKVEIQSTERIIILSFSGFIEARRFTEKIINAVTGTSTVKRGSEKIKDVFDMVDDTLGLDTRNALKGLLENGVKGTIINGIGKKR